MIQASRNAASAEARVRELLGNEAAAAVSHEHVIIPLANALGRAAGPDADARGAVVVAGNAIETYLTDFAARKTINLAGATGINAKLDRIAQANGLPSKIIFIGKYLGLIHCNCNGSQARQAS